MRNHLDVVHKDGSTTKYPLPAGRDLNAAVAEAIRLHPTHLRIKIMLHNTEASL